MKFRALPVLFTALFTAHAAQAGIDKISRPAVYKGELEVEYSGARTSDNSDKSLNNAQSHEIEFEYGLTRPADAGHWLRGRPRIAE